MKSKYFLVFVTSFFACLLGNAWAATLEVPSQYATIQSAIDSATNGDVVLVHDGTYIENINFAGKAITVRSENGASSTVINGDSIDMVVTFKLGEDMNSVLEGFTITNGKGGIYCHEGVSPTIKNCIVTENTDNEDGGGIYCHNNSFPSITNCTIAKNTASNTGGGIHCHTNSFPSITNCTITENTAYNYGGGIYCHSGASPIIINCTITKNTAYDAGGGIYGQESSSPTIVNSIFWEDKANGVLNEIDLLNASTNISYSNIQGGYEGTGNIDINPLFIDIVKENYNIRWDSPCIDAANSDSALDTDKDGRFRYDDRNTTNTGTGVNGDYYDIGAYEYNVPTLTEWGIILLSLLILGKFYKRKQTLMFFS